MRIDSPATLADFRLYARCPGCGQTTGLVPHHAIIRCGMGGGSRLDVPCNLLSVCVVCNGLAEQERTMNARLLDALIQRLWREARSTAFTLQTVREYLWGLLRLPKGSEVPKPPWEKKESA